MKSNDEYRADAQRIIADTTPRPAPLAESVTETRSIYFSVVGMVTLGPKIPCHAQDMPAIPSKMGWSTVQFKFNEFPHLAGGVPYTLRFWENGKSRIQQQFTFDTNAVIQAVQVQIARPASPCARVFVTVESPIQVIARSMSILMGRNR